MYLTVNLAFTNYINQFNCTEELEAPTITNKTTLEFTLPIFLNKTTIDDTLFSAALTLKEYVNQYKHKELNFSRTEPIFSENTSFCQSN